MKYFYILNQVSLKPRHIPFGFKVDTYLYINQSHNRVVPWWDIFMEQELKFGLDLGRFGNFWDRFFHVFMGKKKDFKNIVDSENIFGIKSFKKFRLRNIFNCVLLQ